MLDLVKTGALRARTRRKCQQISLNSQQTHLVQLKNGKAAGKDGIPGELLKYAAPHLCTPIADIMNQGFEEGEQVNLGEGILICLQKPNKPKGACSSLRPIVLLNTIRKAISIVTLNRISDKVNNFLSPFQSGFRKYRGKADAVWAHRWLSAQVQFFKKRYTFLELICQKPSTQLIEENFSKF